MRVELTRLASALETADGPQALQKTTGAGTPAGSDPLFPLTHGILVVAGLTNFFSKLSVLFLKMILVMINVLSVSPVLSIAFGPLPGRVICALGKMLGLMSPNGVTVVANVPLILDQFRCCWTCLALACSPCWVFVGSPTDCRWAGIYLLLEWKIWDIPWKSIRLLK